jgi:hypothetical protein
MTPAEVIPNYTVPVLDHGFVLEYPTMQIGEMELMQVKMKSLSTT